MTRFITLGLLASVGAYLRPAPGRLRAVGRKHRCNVALAAANEPQQHAVDAAPQNRAPVIAALAAASAVAAPALAADALPSAIAAYSHYLALMGIVGSLTTERLLLKEDMSEESFDLLATADIVYGLSGLLILVSGYFRATAYAKGWEFYAHEPLFFSCAAVTAPSCPSVAAASTPSTRRLRFLIVNTHWFSRRFWVKMSLLAVVGSASYFPTIKIVQRAVAKRDGGDVPPLSPALVKRMTSIVNAELLGVLSIPFVATLMARGVFYVDGFPWFVGALPVVGCAGFFGYRYATEALDWAD